MIRQSTLAILMVLTLTGMVSRFAENSLLPTLPAMASFFDVSASHMKLAVSVYLIALCVSQLIYGPLSDNIGRKTATLWGLGIAVFGSLLAALAQHVSLLLLGHFIQGLGIGAIACLFRAILRDCYVDRRLAQVDSYLNMTLVFMAPFANIVGAWMGTYWGWQSNFWTVFGLAMVAMGCLCRMMPETLSTACRTSYTLKTVGSQYANLLMCGTFMRYTLLAAFIYGGFISYLTITPFLYQHVFQLSPKQFSYLSFIIAMGFLIGACINVYIIKYINIYPLLILSLYLALFSAIMMMLLKLLGFSNVLVVIVPMAIYVMATSIALANAFTLAFEPLANKAGLASALYTSIQMLIAGLFSSISAFVPNKNQMSLALMLLLGTCIAIGCVYTGRR